LQSLVVRCCKMRKMQSIFGSKVVIFTARNTNIYKICFTGLYFLHFTTFSDNLCSFTHSKTLFLAVCWISFFLPWSKFSLYCSWNHPLRDLVPINVNISELHHHLMKDGISWWYMLFLQEVLTHCTCSS
jgi:hypothetical protein